MLPAPQPLRTQRLDRPASPRPARIEYPESDGKPMAETPVHMKAMNDAIMPLEERFAERSEVYVGGNMMMYYVEGATNRSISADVFVAFGPARRPLRRVWKTWEEGKLADFVLEVTSNSTRKEDEGRKREIYRREGVTEYWQFDPTGDYLTPVLKGRRLNARGAYRPIRLTTTPDGIVCGVSKVLGLQLCLDDDRLRFRDAATGKFLLTHDEYVRAWAEKDRTIEDKDRIIEELKRRLADS